MALREDAFGHWAGGDGDTEMFGEAEERFGKVAAGDHYAVEDDGGGGIFE